MGVMKRAACRQPVKNAVVDIDKIALFLMP